MHLTRTITVLVVQFSDGSGPSGKRGSGFVLPSLPATLPSMIYYFFSENKGGGAGPGTPLLDPPLQLQVYKQQWLS